MERDLLFLMFLECVYLETSLVIGCSASTREGASLFRDRNHSLSLSLSLSMDVVGIGPNR